MGPPIMKGPLGPGGPEHGCLLGLRGVWLLSLKARREHGCLLGGSLGPLGHPIMKGGGAGEGGRLGPWGPAYHSGLWVWGGRKGLGLGVWEGEGGRVRTGG